MPPLITAITGLFTSLGFAAATAGWLAGFVVRMVLSLGLSALARAKAKRNDEQVGIKGQATQTGGTDPESFIIGRYATGGQLVTPPMSHGSAGKTPNAYYTYVVAVSDVPGATLERLFIDGEVTTIGGPADPTYGFPVQFKGRWDSVWVKWYDGTQTAADPMLIAKYSGRTVRAWAPDMVGKGIAYAILTFKFDREIFKGFPAVRFEVRGIPLYDPRKDPAMGGAGSQSWTNPATWQQTDNPVVMIYNILRGISIPGGDVWGGGWSASDLPTANWFAAMNAADQPVALAAGGTEPRYRAGFEVAVDQEPGDVIAELLKTCAGRMADVGGTMKIAVGAPGMPVKVILDEDIIITDEQTHSLFPSLAQTHNGVHATFPDPASLWESRDAPPRYDAVAEAQDGRRLTATVSLPACPFANQVQRLMVAWVNEERRFRRHQFVLPPDATILEPHDVISWTSVQNGYSGKLFEVAEIVHDPVSLLQLVSLREVDPSDYDWNSTLELPWVAPAPGAELPPAQSVTAFAVSGTALDDASLTARRPALLLTWDGLDQVDVTALEYEVRRLGGAQTVGGVTTNVASGSQIVAAGILPETTYEVRARFIAPRQTLWTAWLPATTPAAYITVGDFEDFTGLFKSAGLSVPTLVSALPPAGPARFQGELVYLTADNKLYRWDGAQWTAEVPVADLTGRVASSQLLIADLSNLCEDPGFELMGAGWGAGGPNGFTIPASNALTGSRAAERAHAGIPGTYTFQNTMVFDARAGSSFRLSAYVKRSAAGVCTAAGVRISWLSGSGAVLSSSDATLAQASLTTSYQRVTGMFTAPASSVYARVELVVLNQSAGSFFWDDIYCYRANGGELIVDGTVFGNHIAANTITGGLLATTGLITQVAQIADGIITNAKIANLSVDTIKIADGAVTKQASAVIGSSLTLPAGGGYQILANVAVTVGDFPVLIFVQFSMTNPSAGIMVAPRRNGTSLLTGQTASEFWMANPYVNAQPNPIMVTMDFPGAGTHNYQIYGRCDGSMPTNTVYNRMLVAQSALK